MNENYITYLQAQNYSNATIKNYSQYIKQMLNYVNKPEKEICYLDLVNWVSTINHLKPNSQNIQISAAKSYFSFLKKCGVIKEDPTINLKKKKIRECDLKQKPYIKASELRGLVNTASTLRNKAIILLMASTGLRVSEMINITLNQYKNMSGENHRELEIIGKGNKHRRVYINDETKEAIDSYINSNPKRKCENLFVSFTGGPINRNNFGLTLKNIAKKSGVENWKDVSNHALRSAFATTKAEQLVPLTVIQSSMGHSRIETTMRYIKTNQENINKAMANMAF